MPIIRKDQNEKQPKNYTQYIHSQDLKVTSTKLSNNINISPKSGPQQVISKVKAKLT